MPCVSCGNDKSRSASWSACMAMALGPSFKRRSMRTSRMRSSSSRPKTVLMRHRRDRARSPQRNGRAPDAPDSERCVWPDNRCQPSCRGCRAAPAAHPPRASLPGRVVNRVFRSGPNCFLIPRPAENHLELALRTERHGRQANAFIRPSQVVRGRLLFNGGNSTLTLCRARYGKL